MFRLLHCWISSCFKLISYLFWTEAVSEMSASPHEAFQSVFFMSVTHWDSESERCQCWYDLSMTSTHVSFLYFFFFFFASWLMSRRGISGIMWGSRDVWVINISSRDAHPAESAWAPAFGDNDASTIAPCWWRSSYMAALTTKETIVKHQTWILL